MKTVITILLFLFLLVLIDRFLVKNLSGVLLEEQGAKILPALTWNSVQSNNSYLENLSLEQKIGQLFIIGFEGKSITPGIERLIKKLHPGGILLLERNIENPEQLKNFISSFQKIAEEDTELPLFIAVDQEGGAISRIDWVGNTPQSEIKDSNQSYQVGRIRARELKELGINLNLAPLLDTAFPGDFIFERSFQKNPQLIGELAKFLIQGQKEAGVLTAIKHFPGYGGISFNPEEKLAVLDNIPEISQFKKAARSYPEMIMVSNVVYKEIEGRLPFSFSSKDISFLKNEIKGNYLIISDDLAQNSLLNKFSLKEIVTLPIKAGVDILIFSGWRVPAENGISELKKAVKKGEISEDAINQSVARIVELKRKLLK